MALAHVLETVPHCGSQYSKESQSALGTWSLNKEHLFIPGGKHEQKPMNLHRLGPAPMEEAAEFPTLQVEKHGPGGRKKRWVWRRDGLQGSGKAGNAFILCPLSRELRNPGQLTPRSMWLAARLVAKIISRSISVSVRAKCLKPQVCVLIISSFGKMGYRAEAPGIQETVFSLFCYSTMPESICPGVGVGITQCCTPPSASSSLQGALWPTLLVLIKHLPNLVSSQFISSLLRS